MHPCLPLAKKLVDFLMPLHVINVLIFASFYLPVTWIWPWALYLFLFFIGLTFS